MRKFSNSGHDVDWVDYKEVRNNLNSADWKAKQNFFSEKLTDCKDTRTFWKYLKTE